MKKRHLVAFFSAITAFALTACSNGNTDNSDVNTTEAISQQTSDVQEISIETSADVMDLIDEYLTKNGYSNFAYNKNKYDAVFVTGSDFTTMKVNSDRRLTIKPELYITEDYFNGGFIVDSLLFRMELKDTSSQDERYNLTADKLTIKSGSDTLTVTSDIICSSDFESSYYLSRFDYSLSSDDLAKLSQMLDSGTLAFEIKAKNAIRDYSTIPAKTTYETVSITYNFKESDISSLKQTLEIYDYLSSVL